MLEAKDSNTQEDATLALNDKQFMKEALQNEQLKLLLNDMRFISTYGVKLTNDPTGKDRPGWGELWHTAQVSLFAGLFWKLGWIMAEGTASIAVKLAVFWALPLIDVAKASLLYTAVQHQKHGITGGLLTGILLTGLFLIIGTFAALMTTFEVTGTFALTALALPIIFTAVVGFVVGLKAKGIISEYNASNDKHLSGVVQAQHRSLMWGNVADFITMASVFTGIVTMFLLPTLGLIATAPLWAPMVVPAVIVFGLLLKIALQVAQVFKAPVETISIDKKTPTSNVLEFTQSSPGTSLDSNSSTENQSSHASETEETKSLINPTDQKSDEPHARASDFFYTKRRAKTMAALPTIAEQQAYLIKEITALTSDQNTPPVASLLNELSGFVTKEKRYDIEKGASQILSKAGWHAGFKDAAHHESDLQDLSKAAMLFLHDRARARMNSHGNNEDNNEDYNNAAPLYRMTLA